MSATIDQQFVEYIVKSLVSNPDDVKVERRIDEKGVLLELTVNPEDLGRVIGKRGAGAQALRTLLRSLGTKNDARYNLKIVDNGEPRNRDENRSYEPRESYRDEPKKESYNDEPKKEADSEEAPADVKESEKIEEAEEEKEVEERPTSDVISKARKELEELDDLDV